MQRKTTGGNKMYGVMQGDVWISIAYISKLARKEVGAMYADRGETWEQGWEKAKAAGAKVRKVNVQIIV